MLSSNRRSNTVIACPAIHAAAQAGYTIRFAFCIHPAGEAMLQPTDIAGCLRLACGKSFSGDAFVHRLLVYGGPCGSRTHLASHPVSTAHEFEKVALAVPFAASGCAGAPVALFVAVVPPALLCLSYTTDLAFCTLINSNLPPRRPLRFQHFIAALPGHVPQLLRRQSGR